MGRIRDFSREPIFFSLLVAAVVLALAIFVGRRIGNQGLTYQDVIYAGMIVAGVIIALHRRGLEIGYLLWIAMFALGYRSMDINVPIFADWLLTGARMSHRFYLTGQTPTITIHPLTIIIIGLAGLLILQRTRSRSLSWYMPTLLLPFSMFWILGWVQGMYKVNGWYFMFPELLNFLLIWPIFLVTTNLLQKESFWRSAVATFFGVGAVIAALGLLEFLVPGILDTVPGLIANPELTALLAADGFVRAGFAFWGQPAAVFVSALGVCLVIPLWNWFPSRRSRVLLLAGLALDLSGIYVAGWRSLWLLTPLVMLALLSARRNWAGLLVFLIIVYIGYTLLPSSTQERIGTAVSAVQGNYQDGSSADRAFRFQEALDLLTKNPLGMGWAGVGWVHNDFLQVAANLGLGGGLLFALWYLSTLLELWRRTLQGRDSLSMALLGSFLFAGGLFLTQPLIVLPQTAVPAWFIWALATVHLRNTANDDVRSAWLELKSAY